MIRKLLGLLNEDSLDIYYSCKETKLIENYINLVSLMYREKLAVTDKVSTYLKEVGFTKGIWLSIGGCHCNDIVINEKGEVMLFYHKKENDNGSYNSVDKVLRYPKQGLKKDLEEMIELFSVDTKCRCLHRKED